MAEYRTQQKKSLVDFMTEHSQSGYTVEELFAAMRGESPTENVPGKSTLYRLITKLVSAGVVKRFPVNNGRQFRYQIVAGRGCDSHLHLKCMKCGCLYHMDNQLSRKIAGEVLESSAFSLDNRETVLFGICKNCGKF